MENNSNTPETSVLDVSGISYSYMSDWLLKKMPVLKEVTFSVRQGESFGFLGPNGAGKTTTIKCILDLIRPSEGSISINGIPNANPDSRKIVGYLPEQPYFYDHLTAYELVEMFAVLAGVPRRRLKAAVNESLERVNVAFKSHASLRSLSKGLLQRVGMAQAIVAKPKLLILDEPFSGLDPLGRKEFRELFRTLKDEGTTIMMSSHILSDVEFLCDRASILIQGEIKTIFDLRELHKRRSGTVTLSLSHFADAEAAVRKNALRTVLQGEILSATYPERTSAEQALLASLAAGASLESFDYDAMSLEDIFVDMVSKSRKEQGRL